MFQFFCLHFIYFFRDRVSQGWPQTFNSPASVSWVLRIDVHYHGQLFFLWESLCREGLDNLCTSCPFSGLLSWLQSCNCDLPGRNICWGSWAVKLSASTIAKLLSLTWVKANLALCDSILVCFSSRPSNWVMTKHPTPFWKWLHCHRTSLRHETYKAQKITQKIAHRSLQMM